MKDYLVDVPVCVNIWIRPEAQRRQFEVIKQARPSIIFLQSDGGRNEKEWEAIFQNRKIYEEEVDWQCEIHRIYEKENQGLYAMGRKVSEYVWEKVDRCIFLEDDHIPAVTFFRYCAELLERYKDDERIEMICGNNVLTTYPDAEPNDYFFTEVGWSIWGTARWKRTVINRSFPFEYADDRYIKEKLRENMTPFWFEKAKHYIKGELYENHVPGSEYFYMANSVLYHRLSIIPTKNMICNVGVDGTHASSEQRKYWNKGPDVFNLPVYEIDSKIRHPKYIIDDKKFGILYEKKLQHDRKTGVKYFFDRSFLVLDLLVHGGLIGRVKKKYNKIIES